MDKFQINCVREFVEGFELTEWHEYGEGGIAAMRTFISDLLEAVDERDARIAELEAALYPLVHQDTPRDGVQYVATDELRCRHCGKLLEITEYNIHAKAQYNGHDEECAWVLARKVLGD